MRYDEKKDIIYISVKEFVSIARRGISPTLPCDDDEPDLMSGKRQETERETEALTLTAECDPPLCIRGKIGADGDIELTCRTKGAPRKAEKEQIRGEGFLLCYMKMAGGIRCMAPVLKITYINEVDGSVNEAVERPSMAKLTSFFNKCLCAVRIYAKPQVERVTKRLPSMASMRFPYSHIRDGQREFVRTAYRSLASGGRLYASAPTGTGKTVSVLYPALKGLGDGRYDKVFYLTPKTTTARAAKECLELLASRGVVIRAILLCAKERCCRRGLVCREDRRLCDGTKLNRLPDAVMSLYTEGLTVVTSEDTVRVAEAFGICPYELQLAYSELCDAVICDFNYLFDPRVYIRRYFTEGGRFAFLVDEAHNLPDRAREMYSAELSTAELREVVLGGTLGEHSSLAGALRFGADAIGELLYGYVREEMRTDAEGVKHGAADMSEPPSELYDIMDKLTSEAEVGYYRLSADKNARAAAATAKDIYYKLANVNERLHEFDRHFRFLIFADGENIRFKLFCVDTGGVVSRRLDKGYSSVLFSATMEPIEYFKSLLGADGASSALTVGSPFDPSQLSVSIIDRISTRTSERERTLGAVCRTIAATMAPRRGNYMVFAPSFDYARSLFDTFHAKYPHIKALLQTKEMTGREREALLSAFESRENGYLVAFCVMGGIYSEGIDLAGDSLIGAVVVGIGMPSLSYEREAMSAYFEDKYEQGKQYAYVYPGMSRVFQAAGRVIRREDDRGVIVLIDDRFADPIYKKSIPDLWHDMRYIDSAKALKERLEKFWSESDNEKMKRNPEEKQ